MPWVTSCRQDAAAWKLSMSVSVDALIDTVNYTPFDASSMTTLRRVPTTNSFMRPRCFTRNGWKVSPLRSHPLQSQLGSCNSEMTLHSLHCHLVHKPLVSRPSQRLVNCDSFYHFNPLCRCSKWIFDYLPQTVSTVDQVQWNFLITDLQNWHQVAVRVEVRVHVLSQIWSNGILDMIAICHEVLWSHVTAPLVQYILLKVSQIHYTPYPLNIEFISKWLVCQSCDMEVPDLIRSCSLHLKLDPFSIQHWQLVPAYTVDKRFQDSRC